MRLADLHSVDVAQVSYEEFCALWFCRQGSITRKADVLRIGVTAANSTLDLAWFKETRDTKDEAQFAYEYHLAKISEATGQ